MYLLKGDNRVWGDLAIGKENGIQLLHHLGVTV